MHYFVLAAEGSGFRFSSHILRSQNIQPKILLINNESFYADRLAPIHQELINFPRRYRKQFAWFGFAQQIQDKLRRDPVTQPSRLQSYYCSGNLTAGWRSADNGTFFRAMSRNPVAEKIEFAPASRMRAFDLYMKNADAFYEAIPSKNSCSILYLVPSKLSSPQLGQKMAGAIGAGWVFPEVEDLYSYDGSHLDPENSEKWAQAFVRDLDPEIDRCLQRAEQGS